jgi:hypothetical protein
MEEKEEEMEEKEEEKEKNRICFQLSIPFPFDYLFLESLDVVGKSDYKWNSLLDVNFVAFNSKVERTKEERRK